MKKEDVCVLIDTKKKSKKVYKVLRMFNQPVNEYAKQNLISKVFIRSKGYNYIGMELGDWFAHTGDGKTEVSIKQLKQILTKEYLKKGDYIVCSLGGCDYIVEFKSFDEGQFPIEGSRYSILIEGGKVYNEVGRFRYFKRYATKKEIRMLKGTSENIALDNIKEGNKITPEIGKWYEISNKNHSSRMSISKPAVVLYEGGSRASGFNFIGEFVYKEFDFGGNTDLFTREVPFDEVESLLRSLVESKGYVRGAKVKSLGDNRIYRVGDSQKLEWHMSKYLQSLGKISDESLFILIFSEGRWAEIIPDDNGVRLKQGDYIMLKTNRKGIDQLTFKKVTSENKYRLSSCVKDGGHIHITDRKLINELDKY